MTTQTAYPVVQDDREKDFYLAQHLSYTTGATYRYVYEFDLGIWDMTATEFIKVDTGTTEMRGWRDATVAILKDTDAVPPGKNLEPDLANLSYVTVSLDADIIIDRLLEGVAGETFNGFKLSRPNTSRFNNADYDGDTVSRGNLSITVTV